MGRNLASLLTDSAARRPERTAIKLDDVELTYAQLDEARARVAGLLAQRHRAGRQRRHAAAERARLRGRLLRRSCAPAASWCR